TGPVFYTLELNNKEDADPAYGVLNWTNEHIKELQERGFEIQQSAGPKKFLFASNHIDFEIKEENDWFDINAIVYFGSFAVPFIALKQYILRKKREFPLPDGSIAIIPDKWFSQYGSLFNFSDSSKALKLHKHHVGLINDLSEDSIAHVTLNRKL